MNILQKIKQIKVSRVVVFLVFILLIFFGTIFPQKIFAAGPVFNSQGICVENCDDFINMNPYGQGGGSIQNNGFWDSFLDSISKFIGYILMTVSSAFLSLAGSIFDYIVRITIIDMGKNLSDSEGLGGSIREAWITLRDISNMFFIFVLLITAFKTMFSLNFGNTGRAILNIVIVALLINFSLFFTKVVIDASNIVSIGFYDSIVSYGASPAGAPTEASTSGGTQKTITGGYMRMLGLNSWYDIKILEVVGKPGQVIVTGVMASVFFLITAVIFIMSAIMFLARFIILIFLMILSPAALVAIIIPGMKDKFETWKNAVIDQSIFAPVFFALTWVVFKLGNAPNFISKSISTTYTDITTKPPDISSMALVFNYFLLIGMAVMALVVAKKIANRTAYFSTLSGGIGAGVLGTTAFAGRQFLGRGGDFLASKMQAAKGSENFAKRTGARLLSYVGEKAAKSSFDVRNATIPTSVIGDAIRGTVGRTALGKKLGLDDVNIQSIDIGNRLAGGIAGTAEKKGYRELKLESSKRVREREMAEASQIKLAQAKNNILKGSRADSSTIEGQTAIGEMEKALANLSDKETETLVASNRELLKSQNFANAISVKQLEAIVKSDQLSETEKAGIKNIRFEDIYKGVASGATQAQVDAMEKKLSSMSDKEIEMLVSTNRSLINDQKFVDTINSKQLEAIVKSDQLSEAEKTKLKNTRFNDINTAITSGDPAAIATIKGKIKGLSDYELELIDTSHFENENFVAELRPAQIESIIRNNKFTDRQKQTLRDTRNKPIINALRSGKGREAQSLARKVDYKTLVGYMNIIGRNGIPIALDPYILPIYNPQKLIKMADEMNDADKITLKNSILAGGNKDTIKWLKDPDKGGTLFI